MSSGDVQIFCVALQESQLTASAQLIVAPPMIYLEYLRNAFPSLAFAAQDISDDAREYGAHTGDVSASMLRSTGVEYAIIGHSERRTYNHETNMTTRKKAINCNTSGVIPIICIGESKEDRMTGRYKDCIAQQVKECVPDEITDKNFIIAYEPIWAVGTGVIPSVDDIEEATSIISRISLSIAKPLAIVYGGSVNARNVASIASVSCVDGVLLGGASLRLGELTQILNTWK